MSRSLVGWADGTPIAWWSWACYHCSGRGIDESNLNDCQYCCVTGLIPVPPRDLIK